MDLRRGAVYTVIAERGQWLVGEDDSGTQRGEFPRSYVEHGAVLATSQILPQADSVC